MGGSGTSLSIERKDLEELLVLGELGWLWLSRAKAFGLNVIALIRTSP